MLRERFSATRIMLFGSSLHPHWYSTTSDIDLAVWGIAPSQFYTAVAHCQDQDSAFSVDLIDMSDCPSSLPARSLSARVSIYERNYLVLASRIEAELARIAPLVQHAQAAWQRAVETEDDLYVDAVAVNLHSFYSGIERILEAIADSIDEAKPTGDNWHRAFCHR